MLGGAPTAHQTHACTHARDALCCCENTTRSSNSRRALPSNRGRSVAARASEALASAWGAPGGRCALPSAHAVVRAGQAHCPPLVTASRQRQAQEARIPSPQGQAGRPGRRRWRRWAQWRGCWRAGRRHERSGLASRVLADGGAAFSGAPAGAASQPAQGPAQRPSRRCSGCRPWLGRGGQHGAQLPHALQPAHGRVHSRHWKVSGCVRESDLGSATIPPGPETPWAARLLSLVAARGRGRGAGCVMPSRVQSLRGRGPGGPACAPVTRRGTAPARHSLRRHGAGQHDFK